jgi:hypothetical protein
MSKARSMMLFRINRLLSQEQRATLEAIHRRNEAARDHPRSGPRRWRYSKLY